MGRRSKGEKGEKHRMNNGMLAELVEYGDCANVTIRFENGVVKSGVKYGNFKNGSVSCRERGRTPLVSRVGERRIMHNGMWAEIIEYKNCMNITVQFEDGYIHDGVYYSNFKDGKVSYNGKRKRMRLETSRIGEKRTMKNGLEAEIISYRTSADCTIRFENGVCKDGVRYANFKKGVVKCPGVRCFNDEYLVIKESRVGEEKTMRNGLKAVIIDYENTYNCTLKFENGTVVRGISYQSFKNGYVRCPGVKTAKVHKDIVMERMGLLREMNCGKVAKIIEYNTANNMAVQFDDGVIVRGTNYRDFSRGRINPEEGE